MYLYLYMTYNYNSPQLLHQASWLSYIQIQDYLPLKKYCCKTQAKYFLP